MRKISPDKSEVILVPVERIGPVWESALYRYVIFTDFKGMDVVLSRFENTFPSPDV
tara:strand:+ start:1659 stop:1826 length:168 start_codon:yes stop_codon:yes gene_type:complete